MRLNVRRGNTVPSNLGSKSIGRLYEKRRVGFRVGLVGTRRVGFRVGFRVGLLGTRRVGFRVGFFVGIRRVGFGLGLGVVGLGVGLGVGMGVGLGVAGIPPVVHSHTPRSEEMLSQVATISCFPEYPRAWKVAHETGGCVSN
jgi:hypothetical protein